MKERRLAAIVFTDIVGYTTMMGSDEDKAFEVLRQNREIHTKFIEQFNGTLIKEMGDGMLISFNLASEAVRCAAEIQLESKKKNIALRIGIHEGEVVFEDGDVLGDGVNIASRIEESCNPGSILISEGVYNNLRNKRDISAVFVQVATFKNVDHPIRLYKILHVKFPGKDSWKWGPEEQPQTSEGRTSAPSLPEGSPSANSGDPDMSGNGKKFHRVQKSSKKIVRGISVSVFILIMLTVGYLRVFKTDKFESIKDEDGRISIAVMPYRNVSGDTLYNWWQMGIQDILITKLSSSTELSVRQTQSMNLAVQSTKTETLASITPHKAGEIASKLNVKAFVIGSILKAEEKIRLTTQLVATESGEVFKTFELDGNPENDFFTMSDSLSIAIKNFLEIKRLTEKYDNPDLQSSTLNTNSSEAFRYYILGHEAYIQVDNLSSAVDWYLKSIEKDPNFTNAYISLIFVYGILGNDDQGRKYLDLVNEKKANLTFFEQLTLEHLNAYFYGNPEEEINYLHQILKIDQMHTTYWFLLGRAYQKLKQYPEAIASWKKALEIYHSWGIENPNWFIFYWLGDAYHQVGDHHEEQKIYDRGLRQVPDHAFILRNQVICALSMENGRGYDQLKNLMDKARADRTSESNINSQIAYIYEKAGLLDSAENYYRKAVESQSDNPRRMIQLARFLIDHERNVQEGMAVAEVALAIEPENWYGLDAKGWGLYKMGDYEKSFEVLKDAWPLRPSSYLTDAYLHLQAAEKALANR